MYWIWSNYFSYLLTNKKNKSENIKNETQNGVLFYPKNKWNPHSKTLSCSWYGICGDKIKFTDRKIIDNIGIKIIKKVYIGIFS